MNFTYAHLLVNHIPIIGVMIVLFYMAMGFLLKSDKLFLASWIALLGLTIVTAFAYWTGTQAFGGLAKFQEINVQAIGHHAQWAGYTLWGMGINAIASLLSLFSAWSNQGQTRPLCRWGLLIYNLLLLAVLLQTAMLGGSIRHIEVHSH